MSERCRQSAAHRAARRRPRSPLAMFSHFFQDVGISEETLALDMIAEVGPGGYHLGTAHT